MIANTTVKLFVGTPLYNGQVSHMYMRGALECQKAFESVEFSVAMGTYLAINRQTLTDRFLVSDCSHFLMVDSDIGWHPKTVELLLAAGVDLVSGVYIQRNGEDVIPAEPITGEVILGLVECYAVPAGFLLIRREMIERMRGLYPGRPLWTMSYTEGGGYVGEDIHFCRQWRDVGGKVWLHPSAIVDHVGEVVFGLGRGDVNRAIKFREK